MTADAPANLRARQTECERNELSPSVRQPAWRASGARSALLAASNAQVNCIDVDAKRSMAQRVVVIASHPSIHELDRRKIHARTGWCGASHSCSTPRGTICEFLHAPSLRYSWRFNAKARRQAAHIHAAHQHAFVTTIRPSATHSRRLKVGCRGDRFPAEACARLTWRGSVRRPGEFVGASRPTLVSQCAAARGGGRTAIGLHTHGVVQRRIGKDRALGHRDRRNARAHR